MLTSCNGDFLGYAAACTNSSSVSSYGWYSLTSTDALCKLRPSRPPIFKFDFTFSIDEPNDRLISKKLDSCCRFADKLVWSRFSVFWKLYASACILSLELGLLDVSYLAAIGDITTKMDYFALSNAWFMSLFRNSRLLPLSFVNSTWFDWYSSLQILVYCFSWLLGELNSWFWSMSSIILPSRPPGRFDLVWFTFYKLSRVFMRFNFRGRGEDLVYCPECCASAFSCRYKESITEAHFLTGSSIIT